MIKVWILLAWLGFSTTLLAEPLEVTNPWVREAPPSANNLAGYVELTNTSDEAITVEAVSSPLFSSVELHVTSFEDGMMRMTELKQLHLAPNESIKFEPAGKHFMLIKPNRAITSGLEIPIILQIKNAAPQTVHFKVRK